MKCYKFSQFMKNNIIQIAYICFIYSLLMHKLHDNIKKLIKE